MKQEFIFIGPPGSGKGTQTKILSKEYNLPHVDTGSLLREEVASASKEGELAKQFIDKGQLVPAELVSKIIKNRLLKEDCKNGFILDGYPRSIEQAELLDKILKEIDENTNTSIKVFYFEIEEKKLIERLVNRRTCSKCGAIYNLKTMEIKDKNRCEKCGGELTRRKDDTEEVAKKRFDTYFQETEPLIDFYKKRGILITINADNDIKSIYEKLKGAIK